MRLGVSWREDEAEPGTILVSRVVAGSAAQAAGLLPGDRIYQVEGRDFRDGREFAELASTPAARLELLVERRGRIRPVVVEGLTTPEPRR